MLLNPRKQIPGMRKVNKGKSWPDGMKERCRSGNWGGIQYLCKPTMLAHDDSRDVDERGRIGEERMTSSLCPDNMV